MVGENLVVKWDHAHLYGPAPRHRRRLILRELARLKFGEILDCGCSQGYLIQQIDDRFNVPSFGCDVSAEVVGQARRTFPGIGFEVVDLAHGSWPGDRAFDCVVCSEVLEHIEDWQSAVGNLAKMTRRHLLITVPAGPRYKSDKRLGHLRHYAGPELVEALASRGLRVASMKRWGFPFHSLFKLAVNTVGSDALYSGYVEGQYSFAKRVISSMVTGLFYLNDLFRGGKLLIVLAERVGSADLSQRKVT